MPARPVKFASYSLTQWISKLPGSVDVKAPWELKVIEILVCVSEEWLNLWSNRSPSVCVSVRKNAVSLPWCDWSPTPVMWVGGLGGASDYGRIEVLVCVSGGTLNYDLIEVLVCVSGEWLTLSRPMCSWYTHLWIY